MRSDPTRTCQARGVRRRLLAAAGFASLLVVICALAALRPSGALAAAPQAATGSAKDIYDMKCGGCHDNGATGPDLHGLYDRKTFADGTTPVNDDTVRSRIVKGTDIMPGFSDQLSKDQVDALIAYLHTLK